MQPPVQLSTLEGETDLPLGPDLTATNVVSVIGMILGLLLTQGFIDQGLAQTISGIASVVVPLVLAVVAAIVKSKAHSSHVAALTATHVALLPSSPPVPVPAIVTAALTRVA